MSDASQSVDYASMVKTAKDAVDGIEEPYKSLAFQRILDDLLGTKGPEPSGNGPARPPVRSRASSRRKTTTSVNSGGVPVAQPREDPVRAVMQADLDAAKYDELFGARGNLENKSLAVIIMARDKCGITAGLTSPEIAQLLKQKFRVASIYESNISLQLGKARSLFNRTKEGRTYRYTATRAGEKRLAEAINSLKAS